MGQANAGHVLLLLERRAGEEVQGLVVNRPMLLSGSDEGLSGGLKGTQADDLVRSCSEAAKLAWRVLRSSDYPGKDAMSRPMRLRYTLAGAEVPPQGPSADLAFTVMLLLDRLSVGLPAQARVSLVAATGEIFGTEKQVLSGYQNPELQIRAVGGVPAKVRAALEYFEQHGQRHSGRILIPHDNLPELLEPEFQQALLEGVIVPVRQLQDVLDALKRLPLLPDALGKMLHGLRAPFEGNPFRGLQSFDIEHRAQYFGRDEQIAQVLSHLPPDPGAQVLPGVLISGYSGSGKSSLMKAGALGRALYTAPGGYNFLPRPQDLSPDLRPVWRPPALSEPSEGAWAQSLAAHWEAWLPGHPLPHDSLSTLGAALAQRLTGTPGHWVLAIDQMEELVSQTREAERPAVDALLRRLDGCLSELAQAGVWLLGTVREEYATRIRSCLSKSFPGDVVLGTPSAQQHQDFLFDVIDKPCQLAGIEREPQLLDALRTDASDPASVPLLQYALNELYIRASDQTSPIGRQLAGLIRLSIASYEAMGRLQGAINLTAQRLLREQPLQASHVLGLLGRMARKAQGSVATRRRYMRAPLIASAPEIELLEPWIHARLVVRTQDHLEVAHEAVLNHFAELRKWLEVNDALLQWRQDTLLPAMRDWQQSGKKDEWLLDPRQLSKAQQALTQFALLSAIESSFIIASDSAASIKASARARKAKGQLLKARAAALVLLVLASVSAGLLWRLRMETSRANIEAENANKSAAIAKSATAAFKTAAAKATNSQILAEQRARSIEVALGRLKIQQLETIRQRDIANHQLIESVAKRFAFGDAAESCELSPEKALQAIFSLRQGGLIAPAIVRHMGSDCLYSTGYVGHNRTIIRSLAVSPDGVYLAYGGQDGTIRMRDAQTGLPLARPFQGHSRNINSIAFSPDGNFIVSGSDDKTIRVWDTRSGQQIGATMQGHENGVAWVAFSPDGRRIVSAGGWDKTIRIWDAKLYRPIGAPITGHKDRINVAVFSPDGQRIASASHDRSIRLWNSETGEPIGFPLQGHTGQVNSISFSPDGEFIASGSSDKSIRLWRSNSGQPEGLPIEGHRSSVNSIIFSPDGKSLLSGDDDGAIRQWDLELKQEIGSENKVLGAPTQEIAYLPGGRIIASGVGKDVPQLWDLKSGAPVGRSMSGHRGKVYAVAFSPDSRQIVSGGQDGSLLVWDVKTQQLIGLPLNGHQGLVSSAAWSPDGERIVSGGSDSTLRFWKVKTGQAIGDPIRGHLDDVTSVIFSPDGKTVYSGGFDMTLFAWNALTMQLQSQSPRGHKNGITAVAVSPDGKRVVSGSLDSTLRLWDSRSMQPFGPPLQGHTGPIVSVAFSPDGRRIISSSQDRAIRMWDAKTGIGIGEPMVSHQGTVTAVTFSPDGKIIASVGDRQDRTIRIWSATTFQLLAKLTENKDSMETISFSPDGKNMVTGSSGGIVRLWKTAEAVADEWCKAIGRNPTGKEWANWGLEDVPEKPDICHQKYRLPSLTH